MIRHYLTGDFFRRIEFDETFIAIVDKAQPADAKGRKSHTTKTLVVNVERPQHIDVWRVLHGQRDIPAWMQEPETI